MGGAGTCTSAAVADAVHPAAAALLFMDPLPGTPPDLWKRMADYLRGIDASLGERPRSVLVISDIGDACANGEYGGTPVASATTRDFRNTPIGSRIPRPALPSWRHGARAARRGWNPSDATSAAAWTTASSFHSKSCARKPMCRSSALTQSQPRRRVAPGDGPRAGASARRGVLIVGSGMSYHNLRDMFVDRPETNRLSEEFDRWLCEPDGG